MADINKLRLQREEEAKKYQTEAVKWTDRNEAKKLKADIKRIKSARLRAKWGITAEKLRGTSADAKDVSLNLGKKLKTIGKFLKAVGATANANYLSNPPNQGPGHNTPRSKKTKQAGGHFYDELPSRY